jgi:hypothetical protein
MIRRADPGDVNALRAIAAAAYQEYAPGSAGTRPR